MFRGLKQKAGCESMEKVKGSAHKTNGGFGGQKKRS
jgi:hypothetical protein